MAKAKSEVAKNIFDEMEPSQSPEIDIGPKRIQHNNSERKFQLPLEYWGGSELEFTHDIANIVHDNGAIVPSFMMDGITIAYISHRIFWESYAVGEYRTADQYLGEGWKSRLQVFCLLKESDDFSPVYLTFGSRTAQNALRSIAQGRQRVQTMLRKIGYTDRDNRLFWLKLSIPNTPVVASSGNSEKKKAIYPPVVAAPAKMKEMSRQDMADYLVSIYVGHDFRDVFAGGLWDKGKEWSEKQPERLLLDDGTNGGGNTALPPASTEAVVLVDGSLHIPDLSDAKPPAMKACAMSIPGLFNDQQHCDNAFSKLMKRNGIAGATDAKKWEAWKKELLERWDALQALNESQGREAEERSLTPQSPAELALALEATGKYDEMSAMDEVEARAAEDDDDIPAAFQ